MDDEGTPVNSDSLFTEGKPVRKMVKQLDSEEHSNKTVSLEEERKNQNSRVLSYKRDSFATADAENASSSRSGQEEPGCSNNIGSDSAFHLENNSNKSNKNHSKSNSAHEISPSPESPSGGSGSGYDTGDTEKYTQSAEWSDEDSQEAKYWDGDGHVGRLTRSVYAKVKLDPTQKLKEKLKLISKWSQQDTKEYREGYPGKADSEALNDNYLFYTNQIPSKPDGDKIEFILENWKGNYQRLERHHGYIQWLFPIREPGMNWHCQELQKHEIEDIKKDKEASDRFVKSYELMLDFYGLRLKDKNTGELERAENWKERLDHLNMSYHNYLRITRILKSMGELGYEHYKSPFVKFMLNEALYEQTIPNAAKSCVEYWLYTIRDKEERSELVNFVKTFIESD